MKVDDIGRLHSLFSVATKNPLFVISLAALALIGLIFHIAPRFAPAPSFESFLLYVGLSAFAFVVIMVVLMMIVKKAAF